MKDKKMAMEKQAKMELLKDLRRMAMDMIHEGAGEEEMLEPMKKVTVAAKDEEGLKKGLEKAEDILETADMDEMDSEDEMEDEEDAASLEAQIAALQEKLAKKKQA